MIIAFDTYYYNNFSYTVGGVFDSWLSKNVKYYVTSKREVIDADYKCGELYKREITPIIQCLKMANLDAIDTIIIDGFVWLTDDGINKTKGLGMRLVDALLTEFKRQDITVVGIAKNKYEFDIPQCIEIKRGLSKKPLWITCSDINSTNNYANLIKHMFGENRIPSIIKDIDSKTRELQVKMTEDFIIKKY